MKLNAKQIVGGLYLAYSIGAIAGTIYSAYKTNQRHKQLRAELKAASESLRDTDLVDGVKEACASANRAMERGMLKAAMAVQQRDEKLEAEIREVEARLAELKAEQEARASQAKLSIETEPTKDGEVKVAGISLES